MRFFLSREGEPNWLAHPVKLLVERARANFLLSVRAQQEGGAIPGRGRPKHVSINLSV